MTSLREALAAKRARTDTFPVAVRDPQAARAVYDKATQDEAMLRFRGATDDELAAAKAAVAAAEADLRDCFYNIELHSIAPGDYEALQAQFTTGEDTLDVDKMLPALLAVSIAGGDLSADEWTTELKSGRWSAGDRMQLFRIITELNVKSVSEGLPKG